MPEKGNKKGLVLKLSLYFITYYGHAAIQIAAAVP